LVASIAAAVFAVALAALAFIHFRERPPVAEAARFEIGPPRNARFSCCLSISPDGRKIAFTAQGDADTRPRLFVRALDTLQAKSVYTNLTGVTFPSPFWSADGRFVAFNSGGKLKKVEASGGPPQTICDTPSGFIGGAWSPDGVIVIDGDAGLMRVPAAGGDPSPLTRLDPSRRERGHHNPALLPDGRHFVYLRSSSAEGKSGSTSAHWMPNQSNKVPSG
jgi:Tol biopolymer transport system component